jgi:hypothetical protein
MIKLRDRGVISDEVLLLYGMSGELPDRQRYVKMSQDEGRAFWEKRFNDKLGENWQEHIVQLPAIFGRKGLGTNWLKEGF